MNNIQTLYKYLMLHLQASNLHWYQDYKRFTTAVNDVRNTLATDDAFTLDNPQVYQNQNFFNNWNDFLNKIFANTSNGISSNGQSIFSNEMFQKALQDRAFIDTLTQLVKSPSKSSHDELVQTWRKLFDKRNPVQINRASAACNINLSSTVDEGKFNIIFDWFIENKYIPPYTGDHNWYDKNIYLINEIRNRLKSNNDYISFDNNDQIKIDEHWVSIFVWLAYENIAHPFHLNKQVIKYGAPGTGKTFLSKQVCHLQFELWKHSFDKNNEYKIQNHIELVQFHPTYSYEDFVEGIRPVNVNGNIQLQLKNGIFKQLCKKAGSWEIDLFHVDPDKSFSSWTVADIKSSQHARFSTDHWAFIQNLEDHRYIQDLLPPYFLIIDEINRAELSAVFGELMYCLEYRGAENAIKTQYSELNTEDTALLQFQDNYSFFVPHNLYIIGTMNTIDRSVDSFDFALRRRFRWEKVLPNMDILKMNLASIQPNWLNLVESVKKLNERIKKEELLGEDYQLGHAYFWNLRYPKDLNVRKLKVQIWDDRLGALIEEYLRGSGRNDLIEELKREFIG